MGRLNAFLYQIGAALLQVLHKWSWADTRRIAANWVLPVLLSVVILFGINTQVQADPAPTTSELAQYLENNELRVATAVTGDYSQVYYRYQGRSIVLTKEGYNHSHAVSSGRYIAWEGLLDGDGQIFLYDILSDSLIQLSSTGNNQTPFVYQNTVTWQSWDGQRWQIMYYDGFSVRQITDGSNPAVYASTNGRQILYAEQLESDHWKAQAYEISSGEVTTIREGDTASTAYPQFTRDGITTKFLPQ